MPARLLRPRQPSRLGGEVRAAASSRRRKDCGIQSARLCLARQSGAARYRGDDMPEPAEWRGHLPRQRNRSWHGLGPQRSCHRDLVGLSARAESRSAPGNRAPGRRSPEVRLTGPAPSVLRTNSGDTIPNSIAQPPLDEPPDRFEAGGFIEFHRLTSCSCLVTDMFISARSRFAAAFPSRRRIGPARCPRCRVPCQRVAAMSLASRSRFPPPLGRDRPRSRRRPAAPKHRRVASLHFLNSYRPIPRVGATPWQASTSSTHFRPIRESALRHGRPQLPQSISAPDRWPAARSVNFRAGWRVSDLQASSTSALETEANGSCHGRKLRRLPPSAPPGAAPHPLGRTSWQSSTSSTYFLAGPDPGRRPAVEFPAPPSASALVPPHRLGPARNHAPAPPLSCRSAPLGGGRFPKEGTSR